MSRKKKRTVNQAEIKRMKALRKTGMPIEKIAEIMGRELRTVQKYLAIEDIEIERQRQLTNLHVRELTDQLNSLRLCLEHPGVELAIDRGLLTFRGHDWRLDPIRWFCLSTPDIDSDDWKPYLEQLTSHTIEWSFWVHLKEMREIAQSFSDDIYRIGCELSEGNPDFNTLWNKVVNERIYLIYGSQGRPSRTNLHPEPELIDMIPYFNDEKIEHILQKIENHLSEPLWEKQGQLENMLEQLTVDFSDMRSNEWIVKGHCDGCP